MHIFQSELCFFIFAAAPGNCHALGICDAEGYFISLFAVHNISLHDDLCRISFYCGSYIYSRAAQMLKLEMGFGDRDNIHSPIKTAIEGKVSGLGINALICGVIHQNNEAIFVSEGICYLNTPG